ncbi:MAG: hypothetical protein HYY45_08345 [Deltaproteobacteria bacterium]|nr:hypothetical protein [Deltaproteobacteria bacterium]
MALAALSLLAALWSGLARLGWDLPLAAGGLKENHGPLMVVGFLGTLISLERAVALRRVWPYGAPLFAALSSLSLLIGLPLPLSQILAAAAGLFLISVFFFLCRQQPSAFFLTMGFGAFLWFAGNLLWYVGYPLHQVAPWWIGFLVLTIAGERLELSRLMRLSVLSRTAFFVAIGVFLFGLGVSLFTLGYGLRLSALALIAVALWLLRYDIAWRSVRQVGLPRYMAVCLLSGYVWLGIGGLLWLLFADVFIAGRHYDAMLHSIFLGFVFSMIFAHAPIIFPSITGLAMPFRRAFYIHVGLLHVSLMLRVGGDLGQWQLGTKWGGLLNALTILLFLANNVRSVKAGHKSV